LYKQRQVVEGIKKLVLGSALEEACTYACEFIEDCFK